jgi:NAD(P)H-dependent FMN reductase
MKLNLAVVVASTRPGRIGPLIADWFLEVAGQRDDLVLTKLDLQTFGLPLFDEPHHPATGRYEHDHTRSWSAAVSAADAFLFVMPEYNAGPPPSLMNALNFLHREWVYKPAAFVSYGGISGGLRAVQSVKPILNALRIVPVNEGVVLPNVHSQVAGDRFVGTAVQAEAVDSALNELHRVAAALAPLRGG